MDCDSTNGSGITISMPLSFSCGVRHVCCSQQSNRLTHKFLSFSVSLSKSFTISNWISRKWKLSSPFFPDMIFLRKTNKHTTQAFYGRKHQKRTQEETNTHIHTHQRRKRNNMIHRNFIYNDLWIMCLLPVYDFNSTYIRFS